MQYVSPSLADGCEWTMRALHAEAVAAARRGVPPTWLALSPERRETLVHQNWNRACGALAANEHSVRTGKFVGAGHFADEVAAEKAAAAAAVAAATASSSAAAAAATNGTTASNATVENTTIAPNYPPPPVPPFPAPPHSPPPAPPSATHPNDPGFNVTRAIISVCALLRLDARAHAHLLGVVVEASIHPFSAGEVRESCVLVTGTSACRGRAAHLAPTPRADKCQKSPATTQTCDTKCGTLSLSLPGCKSSLPASTFTAMLHRP